MSIDCRCGISLFKDKWGNLNVPWENNIMMTFNSDVEDFSLSISIIENGDKIYTEAKDDAVFDIYEHHKNNLEKKMKKEYCERCTIETDRFTEFIDEISMNLCPLTDKLFFIIF